MQTGDRRAAGDALRAARRGARVRSAQRPRRPRARLAEGRAGRGRARRRQAPRRSPRRPGRASRTASSSSATASSPASGTSTAPGPNTTQDVFSATKSVASTLVGIAQDDGDLRIGEQRVEVDPAVEGHAVGGRHRARPAEHGLGPPVEPLHRLRPPARRARPHGLRDRPRPGAAPGKSGPTTTRRCRRSTACCRRRPARTSRVRRAAPLRAARHDAHDDGHRRAGNAQMFEGIRSTCRDLARFGLLMLDQRPLGRQADRLVAAGCAGDAVARRRS